MMRLNLTRSMRGAGVVVTLLVAVILFSSNQAFAWQSDSHPGAQIFPGSTNLYMQIDQPDVLIDKVMEHPLRHRIEALPPVKEALNGAELKQARLALAFMETRIGEEWLPALKSLTDDGMYVGADLRSQAVGIAFRAGDEALLKKTAGEILGFVKNQTGDGTLQIEDYRGGKFATLDNVSIARFGDWFLLANQDGYARKMADNLVDSIVEGKQTSDSLAGQAVFANAWKAIKGKPDAWAFADLDFLRKAAADQPIFAGATDNPALELLFGGILEAMEDAEYVSASLELNEQGIALKSSLPFDASSFQEPREFYFGNQAMGRAPALLDVPGLLGQVSSYRDLGRWWLSKEELFPESVIAELALADSQLSTFFGGADFGEEILGALQPGLCLVAKEQSYEGQIDPDIKLPAFALIGRLQNPDRETRFRISFNSFVTLLNLSDENNMPQFDVQTMNQSDYRITSARYLVEDGVDEGLMYYNFSPSIAFQDDYMIISSTEEFAHELAMATKTLDSSATSDCNTQLRLHAREIKRQLEVNKQSLIAQSMVEGGKSREQSTAEIDLALSLLDYAKQATVNYRIQPQQMELDIELEFNDP